MTLQEGQLSFSFPKESVTKYDDWAFYRNQLTNACGGMKAVDFIYKDGDRLCLIEVKDYRQNRRTKKIDLASEVAQKVRDTLAGLVAARQNATVTEEKEFSKEAFESSRIQVVLHLEQPAHPSKLFPQVADPMALKTKLKQNLRFIDPHAIVSNRKINNSKITWQVESI